MVRWLTLLVLFFPFPCERVSLLPTSALFLYLIQLKVASFFPFFYIPNSATLSVTNITIQSNHSYSFVRTSQIPSIISTNFDSVFHSPKFASNLCWILILLVLVSNRLRIILGRKKEKAHLVCCFVIIIWFWSNYAYGYGFWNKG